MSDKELTDEKGAFIMNSRANYTTKSPASQEKNEAANNNARKENEASALAYLLGLMNTRYAMISQPPNMGHIAVISYDEKNQRKIDVASRSDVKSVYANKLISFDNKLVNPFDYWLRSMQRRDIKGIIFRPGIANVDGYLNLWDGFAVEPKRGDCSLYLNHVFEVIASGKRSRYEYILAFLADIVQRPEHIPGIALVLRGEQGVGKGLFATEFGALFGHSFSHLTQSKQLTGNFNAHMQGKLVAFVDEGFWAGDKAGEGVLKGLITERTFNVEPKHRDVYPVDNFLHFIIASNKSWVVPAAFDERRFFVIDVSNVYQGNRTYFTNLTKQMNNGGREALLYHLLHEIDLSKIELRDFERTDALYDQIRESYDAVQRWLLDFLAKGELTYKMRRYSGDWNEGSIVIAREHLHELFLDYCSEMHLRNMDSREFGRRLKTLLPFSTSQSRAVAKTDPSDSRESLWIYRFPSLMECRNIVSETMRLNEHFWEEALCSEDENSQ